MKINHLSAELFWEKVKANKPTLTDTSKYLHTYIRKNNLVIIFPIAYINTKETTSLYEVIDDTIYIDMDKKLYIANKHIQFTKNMEEVLQQEGFTLALLNCSMCVRTEKCANFIKESLKQLGEEAPCLTEKEDAKPSDQRYTIWFDQLCYKYCEEEINAAYDNYKKGGKTNG